MERNRGLLLGGDLGRDTRDRGIEVGKMEAGIGMGIVI